MSPEVVLVAGYAGVPARGAPSLLEWLSAHTHRRVAALPHRGLHLRRASTTTGSAPRAQHLWPHEFDHERRLVRYRAKAHICNGCPRKEACTDSDHGREIVRPLDPWPHSEAGRFHRGLSLMLVALRAARARRRRRAQPRAGRGRAAARRAGCVAVAVGRWLWRDFRAHPRGLPGARAVARALRLTSRRGGTHRRDGGRWTLIRFLHLVALAFFVGGQLHARGRVVPAVRCDGDEVRCAPSPSASASAAWSRSACSSHRRRDGLALRALERRRPASEAHAGRAVGVLIAFHITTPAHARSRSPCSSARSRSSGWASSSPTERPQPPQTGHCEGPACGVAAARRGGPARPRARRRGCRCRRRPARSPA